MIGMRWADNSPESDYEGRVTLVCHRPSAQPACPHSHYTQRRTPFSANFTRPWNFITLHTSSSTPQPTRFELHLLAHTYHDGNQSPRGARKRPIRWNHEMRTAIWLMWPYLKLDRPTRTGIFNSMFSEQLESMGLTQGVTHGRLDVQYYEHQKPHGPWRSLLDPQSSEIARRERENMLDRILGAAAQLSISITRVPVDQQIALPVLALEAIPTAKKRSTDAEDQTAIAAPRKRRLTSVKAMITSEGPALPPSDPLKTPKPGSASRTELYTDEAGCSVWLSPLDFVKTHEVLQPVSWQEAHPPQSGGLLFRYWNETSQCPLINGGFKAKRFANRHLAPPPLPESDSVYFPWDDLHAHLNRDKTETRFISTTNYLPWVVRLAIKEANRGKLDGRITMIDSSRLQPSQILHVPPFHKELRKKYAFTNAAWCYHGNHEFVVYGKASSILLDIFS